MKPAERIDDLLVAVQHALDGVQPGIWTALPGIVENVDLEKGTCSVQPAIKAQLTDKTGKKSWVAITMCVDVPIQFMGTDEFAFTFPFKKGNEGLLVFACRCIDSWWQSGGVQTQAELRMHDLSDGFFVPGFRSQAKKLTNINPDFPEWRNAAGTVKMTQTATGWRVTGTFDVDGTLGLSGGIVALDGTTYTGSFVTTAEITRGFGTANKVSLGTHGHPANNQPPNPGS